MKQISNVKYFLLINIFLILFGIIINNSFHTEISNNYQSLENISENSKFFLENQNFKVYIDPIGGNISNGIVKYKNQKFFKSDDFSKTFFQTGWHSEEKNKDIPGLESIWDIKINEKKNYACLTCLTSLGKFQKEIHLKDNKIIINEKFFGKESFFSYSMFATEKKNQEYFFFNEGRKKYINGYKKNESFKSKNGFFGIVEKNIGTFSSFSENGKIWIGKNKDIYKIFFITDKTCKESEFSFYIAPKDYLFLKSLDLSFLDVFINYGWFKFFNKPIIILGNLIFKYLNNFLLTIILLSLILSLLGLFFSIKSEYENKRLKAIENEEKLIKEKHNGAFFASSFEIGMLHNKYGISRKYIFINFLYSMFKTISLYNCATMCYSFVGEKFLWIKDISEPENYSIFNLYGKLKFSVPNFLNFGFFAIFTVSTIIGFNLVFGEKNEQINSRIFYILPLFFLIVFKNFPISSLIVINISIIFSILEKQIIKNITNKNVY